MLALILSLAVSQAPAPAVRQPIGVVVSSKRVGAEALGPNFAQRVFSALVHENIANVLDHEKTAKLVKAAGFSDARNCEGGPTCLTRLALLLGPRAVVVSVDVGKVARQLVVHLEALGAEGGEPLAVSEFSAPADNFAGASAAPIAEFARALAAKIAPGPVAAKPAELKPMPTDAPIAAIEPAPIEPLPSAFVAEEPPVKARSRALPIALAVGAAVAVGAGIGLTALGMSAKSTYESSRFRVGTTLTGSRLTQAELQSLAARGNLGFTLALTSYIVGACLAVASTFFFASE